MADEKTADEQMPESAQARPKVVRVLVVPPGDEFVPDALPVEAERPREPLDVRGEEDTRPTRPLEVLDEASRHPAPLVVLDEASRPTRPLEVLDEASRHPAPLEVRTSPEPDGAEPDGAPAHPPCVVDCALYIDGVRQPGYRHYAEAFAAARESHNGFVWLGVHEPTEEEFAEIAETFGLHPLAVEDAVKAHQRPKLERYSDMTFVVLKTARYCDHDELTVTSEVVETGDVMLFIGAEYVVSVRHKDACRLVGVRAELDERADLLRHGPWAVFHGITDNIVDRYEEVVQAIEDDIDEVENGVFSRQATDVQRIYHLRRELLEFKRAVVPLGRPLEMLVSGQVPSVPLEIQRYIRDIADHQQRVTDSVAGFDDLLTSILQADLAQIGIQQNNDMRKISSWVAIAAVPTMIAGVYGMNFEHMPELHWRYGYGVVLLLMATVCGGLYRGFRRSGWL
ncbi:MAG: magnesium transporter [Actinomycetota bacterium]|nr:magnesium transporter [Actinomycetota bacterium]